MNAGIEGTQPTPTKLGIWLTWSFNLYLRLLAVVFFVFTIYTWLQAVGFWDGANNRFDTMTRNWKIYTAIMLVLHPVTSVGLWSTLPWGRVVWLMAMVFQTIALLRYGQQLGRDELFILFHAVTLGMYLSFVLAMNFINKEQ